MLLCYILKFTFDVQSSFCKDVDIHMHQQNFISFARNQKPVSHISFSFLVFVHILNIVHSLYTYRVILHPVFTIILLCTIGVAQM